MTHFYTSDDIPLKIEFAVNGVAQNPTTATVKIVDENDVVVVAEGTPVTSIVLSIATYDFLNAAEGNYAIFWTLDFGDAKPTRAKYFRVDTKLYGKVD